MSFYEIYQKSPVKLLLDKARKIIESDKSWEEKYDLIFSEEISKKFSEILPSFEYYDPDSNYDDDVLAWYNAAMYFAKYEQEEK